MNIPSEIEMSIWVLEGQFRGASEEQNVPTGRLLFATCCSYGGRGWCIPGLLIAGWFGLGIADVGRWLRSSKDRDCCVDGTCIS